jgi:hypothetical protein
VFIRYLCNNIFSSKGTVFISIVKNYIFNKFLSAVNLLFLILIDYLKVASCVLISLYRDATRTREYIL